MSMKNYHDDETLELSNTTRLVIIVVVLFITLTTLF